MITHLCWLGELGGIGKSDSSIDLRVCCLLCNGLEQNRTAVVY
jgi:hypothetical protein